jgi:HSP20 family protein
MAEQGVKTQQQGTQQQAQQAKEVTQRTQSGPVARRGAYDPLFMLSPVDFFRMNPFTLMRRMTEEVDRAFGEQGRATNGGTLWTPAIEVSERDGNYVVRAELAGLKPEDVKVEIDGDVLVLQGERKFEHEENKDGVHRTEIRYGQFYRAIPLPEGVKADQAQAKFDNGVLEVAVPVAAQKPNRKQIQVESSSKSSAAA